MDTPGYRIDVNPADDGLSALSEEMHGLLKTCFDQMATSREDFWNPPPIAELAKRFSLSNVEEGTETKKVYESLRAIMPYGCNNRHPRWWGWVNGAGNFTAVGAELVAATMNTNLGGRNQGASEVERAVLEFLVNLAGLDKEKAFGILTTGTSQATIIALATARVKCFGEDVKRKGIHGLPEVAVYAKEGAHVCVAKACEILGHGSDCVRFFTSPDHLKELVKKDRLQGVKPLAVVGTAGCVNRGTYDNLAALGEYCHQEDIWFHVDAAFGFWILLAEAKWSTLIEGISTASSIALDFHKWTGVPYSAGACLIHDRVLQLKTFANRPAYLSASNQGESGASGLAGGNLWFCDYGYDLSRPFSALKVWTVLKSVGTRTLGQTITDNCRQAALMAKLVEERNSQGKDGDVWPACEVVSNVCCLRVRADVNVKELAEKLQLARVVVFSTTIVDEVECLRAALVNHRTTDQDIDIAVEAVFAHVAKWPTP